MNGENKEDKRIRKNLERFFSMVLTFGMALFCIGIMIFDSPTNPVSSTGLIITVVGCGFVIYGFDINRWLNYDRD